MLLQVSPAIGIGSAGLLESRLCQSVSEQRGGCQTAYKVCLPKSFTISTLLFSNPYRILCFHRYHCMYESVEDLPYEDEERFEHTALQYQEKYHKISNKYQKILMQESTVSIHLQKRVINKRKLNCKHFLFA